MHLRAASAPKRAWTSSRSAYGGLHHRRSCSLSRPASSSRPLLRRGDRGVRHGPVRRPTGPAPPAAKVRLGGQPHRRRDGDRRPARAAPRDADRLQHPGVAVPAPTHPRKGEGRVERREAVDAEPLRDGLRHASPRIAAPHPPSSTVAGRRVIPGRGRERRHLRTRHHHARRGGRVGHRFRTPRRHHRTCFQEPLQRRLRYPAPHDPGRGPCHDPVPKQRGVHRFDFQSPRETTTSDFQPGAPGAISSGDSRARRRRARWTSPASRRSPGSDPPSLQQRGPGPRSLTAPACRDCPTRHS